MGDRLIRKIPDGAPNLVTARRIAPTDMPRWTNDQCLHCGSGLASGDDAQFDGTEQAGLEELVEIRLLGDAGGAFFLRQFLISGQAVGR